MSHERVAPVAGEPVPAGIDAGILLQLRLGLWTLFSRPSARCGQKGGSEAQSAEELSIGFAESGHAADVAACSKANALACHLPPQGILRRFLQGEWR